jgi:hypothetical protein
MVDVAGTTFLNGSFLRKQTYNNVKSFDSRFHPGSSEHAVHQRALAKPARTV